MTALGFLIIGDYGDKTMQTVFGVLLPQEDIVGALITGQILLTLAAIVTLVTGWNYLKAGIKHI
jgi:cardiolipin synthase